jgi:hypothetical protein
MTDNRLFIELIKYVLPVERVEYFELKELKEIEGILHIYLEESKEVPEEYKIIEVVEKIAEEKLNQVEEVTLDMSESMRKVICRCFSQCYA